MIRLRATRLPDGTGELRAEVREFLAAQTFPARCDNWLGGIDPEFSRRLGARGWLGMTWPRRYGGHDRGPLERLVVTEELLAAGAPVAAHWISDRQIGPALLRFGSEAQKRAYLPGMARGELLFCIGMSEPDAGSDLASVRTKASRAPGGWVVNGTKIWTSGAHVATAMVALVRTDATAGERHAGLSQLIIDMAADGVTVSPIRSIDGGHHFNEVVLSDVFVPDESVLGRVGDGWRQVTAELAHERSGPERVLSTLPLLLAWCRALAAADGPVEAACVEAVGQLAARCWTLREMSLAVAAALAGGAAPATEAALVKDLGTRFEREVVEVVRRHAAVEPDPGSHDELCRMIAEAVLHTPAFTLRGGTTEVLRRIVATGLGGAMNADDTADNTDEVLAAAERIAAPARDRPAGELDRDTWHELERAGFTLVSVPERLGGSDGTLPQAAAVLRAAGRVGLAAPLAETMWLAGWLLAASGVPVPPGPLTAALAGAELSGARGEWLLDGVLPRVPWAASADLIVVLARDRDGPVVVRLYPGEVELRPGRNLAGEARDDVVCRRIRLGDDRVARAGPGVTAGGFLDRAALARVVALAGATEEILRLTVRHAGEREQFGRPLTKFQAVQQLLAQLAGETASIVVAAQAATLALDGGSAEDAGCAAAAAKSSAARSAGRIAAYGHQVLGAMGFTVEHPLHRSTTRMWAWREEFGNERQHALELGRRMLAGNPWDQLTGNR